MVTQGVFSVYKSTNFLDDDGSLYAIAIVTDRTEPDAAEKDTYIRKSGGSTVIENVPRSGNGASSESALQSTTDVPILLGAKGTNGGTKEDFFKGKIHEVLVYDKLLNFSEVDQYLTELITKYT